MSKELLVEKQVQKVLQSKMFVTNYNSLNRQEALELIQKELSIPEITSHAFYHLQAQRLLRKLQKCSSISDILLCLGDYIANQGDM